MITFTRGRLTFRAYEYGKDGQAIVLLHGFPSHAASWQPIAQELAGRGFRVFPLEQRGYSAGAQPNAIRAYRMGELVGDVAALLDAAGLKKAHIIGHDWGGAVAWSFASTYPERTLSLTSISTPHPNAFGRALRTSRQLVMSWYMLFFQLPFLPERILAANRGKIITRHLIRSGLSTDKAIEYTKHILRRNTLTHALAWYRALRYATPPESRIGPITVRTLYIYGGKDKYLSLRAAELTKKWVSGEYAFTYLPDATHWIPEENPDVAATLIASFLRHS